MEKVYERVYSASQRSYLELTMIPIMALVLPMFKDLIKLLELCYLVHIEQIAVDHWVNAWMQLVVWAIFSFC